MRTSHLPLPPLDLKNQGLWAGVGLGQGGVGREAVLGHWSKGSNSQRETSWVGSEGPGLSHSVGATSWCSQTKVTTLVREVCSSSHRLWGRTEG